MFSKSVLVQPAYTLSFDPLHTIYIKSGDEGDEGDTLFIPFPQ